MNEITINDFVLPKLEIKNYEQLKEQVKQENKKYKGYIVTKETLDTDIKKRAELRNQAKAIDTRRKEIEKQVSAPIKQFKSDCDALIAMFETSANALDTQIKAYELQTKEEKKQQIITMFDELVEKEAISSLVNVDMLFDERYLNKTYELEDIQKDLSLKIQRIISDLQAIKDLNSEYEITLTDSYLKSFDLSSVISENKRLLELKKETMKVEKKQEKIKEEKIQEMLSVKVVTEAIDPIKTYTLRITAEYSKQMQLRNFLKLNNMKVERIDKHE